MTTRTADTAQRWLLPARSDAPARRLATALAIACAAHLVVILSIGFLRPDLTRDEQASPPLEIIVLRNAGPTEKSLDTPDALAQVDRQGGGPEEPPEHDAKITPEPPSEVAEQVDEALRLQSLPPSIPPVDAEAEPAAEQAAPQEAAKLADPEPAPDPRQPPPLVTAAQILASRNVEIAELSARIQRSSVAYAKRQRRKAISASTREYKYASYLEAWRRKVEQVGNLNYPEEARRQRLYGSLILHVALRADGSVEGIRILRSSGSEVLDKAATKIVELAAPFAPFPPDIRAETDVLDITRTWQFLSSNRLGWDN